MRKALLLPLLALSLTAAAQDPVQTDGDTYKVLSENDRVRVLEYRDEPGARTHQHRLRPSCCTR